MRITTKRPAGEPRAATGHDERWVDAVRRQLLSRGIAPGKISHFNANYFTSLRPEISSIVENAGGHRTGMRKELGLDGASKAQIAIALHFMDAPEDLLRKIAENLAEISRNAPGGEELVGELVLKFSDLPYAAAALTDSLRSISEALRAQPGFNPLAMEIMRLTPPRSASEQGLPEAAYFPVTSVKLLRKMAEVMFRIGTPVLVHLKLSRAENAGDALEGLNSLFPGPPHWFSRWEDRGLKQRVSPTPTCASRLL